MDLSNRISYHLRRSRKTQLPYNSALYYGLRIFWHTFIFRFNSTKWRMHELSVR